MTLWRGVIGRDGRVDGNSLWHLPCSNNVFYFNLLLQLLFQMLASILITLLALVSIDATRPPILAISGASIKPTMAVKVNGRRLDLFLDKHPTIRGTVMYPNRLLNSLPNTQKKHVCWYLQGMPLFKEDLNQLVNFYLRLGRDICSPGVPVSDIEREQMKLVIGRIFKARMISENKARARQQLAQSPSLDAWTTKAAAPVTKPIQSANPDFSFHPQTRDFKAVSSREATDAQRALPFKKRIL
jgi:hypothetical protein